MNAHFLFYQSLCFSPHTYIAWEMRKYDHTKLRISLFSPDEIHLDPLNSPPLAALQIEIAEMAVQPYHQESITTSITYLLQNVSGFTAHLYRGLKLLWNPCTSDIRCALAHADVSEDCYYVIVILLLDSYFFFRAEMA